MLSREIGWLPTLAWAGRPAFVLLNTYIDNDPDGSAARSARRSSAPSGRGAVVRLLGAAVEDIRQAEQLRLACAGVVIASLAFVVLGALLLLPAFAFSWPGITDSPFVVVVSPRWRRRSDFHLLVVELYVSGPMRAVAVTGSAVGVALQVWFNFQRTAVLAEERT